MEAYLDNSATTRAFDEVADLVAKVMKEEYGNPSSVHHMGLVSGERLAQARETIAATLKVDCNEIVFTSGGTESDNFAIIGAARANKWRGKHIITTSIEHPAVLVTMEYLQKEGFEITYLPVDHEGKVSLDDLKAAIREDTILVSMMFVNNEIGTIEPIAEAGKLIKAINKDIVLPCGCAEINFPDEQSVRRQTYIPPLLLTVLNVIAQAIFGCRLEITGSVDLIALIAALAICFEFQFGTFCA